MMMASDPKKLAVMIVAGHKPSSYSEAKKHNEALDPSAPEGEDDSKDMDEGLHSAAEEIITAMDQKDAGALVEALKNFVEMCEDYEEKDEGSEEE